MAKPAVSLAIDIGPSSQRRDTRRRRVSSPSAPKTAAEAVSATLGLALCGCGKVFLDKLHDDRPALFVFRKRLRAAREWNSIEAGLGHCQLDAAVDLLEPEKDERRRLPRVVDARVDGVGMPAERKEPLGLNPV